MNRALIGISLLQTAALFYVGVRMTSVETKIEGRNIADAATFAAAPAAAISCPSLAEIRTALAASPVAVKSPASAPAPAVATAPVARAEAPPVAVSATSNITLADARSDLSRYLAQGRMSPAEMDDFHSKIAELSQEDRRLMLKELTGAMNAGRLDARL